MHLQGTSQCGIIWSLPPSSEMQSKRSVAVRDYTALTKVSIVVADRSQAEQLTTELTRRGFDCLVISADRDVVMEQIAGRSDGVALLVMEEASEGSGLWELAETMRQGMSIPLIALVSKNDIDGLDSTHLIDDFVVEPWEANEVTARIKRVLQQNGGPGGEDTVRCGDLVIDLAKCEVSLGGRMVILTFREYQLLKFLANNRGKVFTRDALLNRVWGWDYYGGDRTVDVHIRRLRSKIEDMDHSFIETIRNVGYRFIEPRV
jgi:two-component system alkaline phosphatase synthesis response regulator PhoP